MVRDDRYKLAVDSLTREPLELYDMLSDPNELRNLVKNSTFGGIRDALIGEHLDPLLDRLDQDKLRKYQETLNADPNRGGWKAIEQAA